VDAGKHEAFMAAVKMVSQTAVDMPSLVAALDPLYQQARRDGLFKRPHNSKRQVLPLTRRNPNKWAASPHLFALAGVDE